MRKLMSKEERERWIEQAFDDPQVIQGAIAEGVADARKKYTQAGYPMATWRSGRVVWVNPATGAEVPRPPRMLDGIE